MCVVSLIRESGKRCIEEAFGRVGCNECKGKAGNADKGNNVSFCLADLSLDHNAFGSFVGIVVQSSRVQPLSRFARLRPSLQLMKVMIGIATFTQHISPQVNVKSKGEAEEVLECGSIRCWVI